MSRKPDTELLRDALEAKSKFENAEKARDYAAGQVPDAELRETVQSTEGEQAQVLAGLVKNHVTYLSARDQLHQAVREALDGRVDAERLAVTIGMEKADVEEIGPTPHPFLTGD